MARDPKALKLGWSPGTPYITLMSNRFRGVTDWSQIPREIAGARLNFEYNPNVAPTEFVPIVLGERDKQADTRMARFGIVLKAAAGKKRPSLLNARADTLRRGRHRSAPRYARKLNICATPLVLAYYIRQ